MTNHPSTHQGAQRFVAVPLSRTGTDDDDGIPKVGEWARVVNRLHNVGFWLRPDAEEFARHETARTDIEHAVTDHPIGGTTRVVYDVIPVGLDEEEVA